jgi:hypothetical protein
MSSNSENNTIKQCYNDFTAVTNDQIITDDVILSPADDNTAAAPAISEYWQKQDTDGGSTGDDQLRLITADTINSDILFIDSVQHTSALAVGGSDNSDDESKSVQVQ